LTGAENRKGQAGEHAERTGDQHEREGQGDRHRCDLGELGGEDEQAEDEEHGDLGQPAEPVGDIQDEVAVAADQVSQDKSGQVDGQELVATDEFGQAERDQPDPQHEDGV
jgi:hypothetical protein